MKVRMFEVDEIFYDSDLHGQVSGQVSGVIGINEGAPCSLNIRVWDFLDSSDVPVSLKWSEKEKIRDLVWEIAKFDPELEGDGRGGPWRASGQCLAALEFSVRQENRGE